jgi:hypothetical protein
VLDGRGDPQAPPVVGGALVLAITVASMATFVLPSGLEYFGHGRQFALPVARLLEQVIPIR